MSYKQRLKYNYHIIFIHVLLWIRHILQDLPSSADLKGAVDDCVQH